MMYRLLWRFPLVMPLGMTLLNVASLYSGLVYEKRFRESALKFMFLYASTIPSAVRGDMVPFFTVLSQPG